MVLSEWDIVRCNWTEKSMSIKHTS